MKLSLLALMLLNPLGVIGKRCPDESLIRPCNCTEDKKSRSVIKCSDFDSLDDLQKMFDNSMDYSFDVLVLSKCVVPQLNTTWFSSKRVKELKLRHLTLIDLMDSTDITVPSLASITIRYTSILRTLRWQLFRVFNQLIQLNIEDMKVRKLGSDFSYYVPASLVSLGIKNANMTALKDDNFQGKTKLVEIVMPNNRIKILKNSFFRDQITILKVMDFSYNPIEYVPGDLFEGMTSLLLVSLQGAHIKTLPKEVSLSKHIGILVLSENPLICNCKMSWIPVRKISLFSVLLGVCESPPSLKSKPLNQLTDEDFGACNTPVDTIFRSGF